MAQDVVLIILDTMRRDRVSPYNDAVGFTEHLEAFASRETVTTFTTAISQGPWSLPSHTSLFTGQYPWEHGATQETLYADTEPLHLPERFQDAGYSTTSVSDNPWITRSAGLHHGFDTLETFFPGWFQALEERGVFRLDRLFGTRAEPFIDLSLAVGQRVFGRGYRSLTEWQDLFGDSEQLRTEMVLDTALDHLRDQAGPSFTFVNLMELHTPRDPPDRYWERHAGDHDREEVPVEPPYQEPGRAPDADCEGIRAVYDATMDCTDDLIGQFLEELEAEGAFEDSIIVITADHGELLGEDGQTGHSFSVHDQLVHVPLLVHHPDGPVEDRPVELRELYDLLPHWAGLTDDPGDGPAFLRGGYGFPDLELKTMETDPGPHDSRLRFAQRDGRKLIERTHRDGTTEHTMLDLETREELPVDEEFLEALPDG